MVRSKTMFELVVSSDEESTSDIPADHPYTVLNYLGELGVMPDCSFFFVSYRNISKNRHRQFLGLSEVEFTKMN